MVVVVVLLLSGCSSSGALASTCVECWSSVSGLGCSLLLGVMAGGCEGGRVELMGALVGWGAQRRVVEVGLAGLLQR